MKNTHSNKSIQTILTGAVALLFIAGLSTPALADNKAAVKNAIGGKIKPATQIKPTKIAKAPTDAGFKKLDTNGDGKISMKEAVKDAALAVKFNDIDINHDGSVAADEYAGYTEAFTKPTAVN